jgi:GntR family transcriptional regulator/MocR family aminotransferase
LVARTLFSPGDVVAVEALGYRPAWEAFRGAGARCVPLPVDEGGLDVAALAELARETRVRAVYVSPHHQYPTTVTLAAGRRLELLELARRARFAILEDDYDHEFHFDGRPVLPLASADRAGVVVYLGTLSKVLAPGLRIGYLVAPRALVERVGARRRYLDRQGDFVVEHAVAELFEDGEIGRHVRRARRAYLERRGVLVEGLRQRFGSVLSFATPAGGTAIWARVAPDVAPEAWAARARARGVVFQTGRVFAYDGRSRPLVRFGFAQASPSEIREALKRLEAAL